MRLCGRAARLSAVGVLAAPSEMEVTLTLLPRRGYERVHAGTEASVLARAVCAMAPRVRFDQFIRDRRGYDGKEPSMADKGAVDKVEGKVKEVASDVTGDAQAVGEKVGEKIQDALDKE